MLESSDSQEKSSKLLGQSDQGSSKFGSRPRRTGGGVVAAHAGWSAKNPVAANRAACRANKRSQQNHQNEYSSAQDAGVGGDGNDVGMSNYGQADDDERFFQRLAKNEDEMCEFVHKVLIS